MPGTCYWVSCAAGVALDTLVTDRAAHVARTIEQLERALATGDVPSARQQIREQDGGVTVDADVKEIRALGERRVAAALVESPAMEGIQRGT